MAGQHVPWPRQVGGRTVWMPTPIELLPHGWQNLTIRQPMRLASCQEVECPRYTNGWTEVFTADGNRIERTGHVSQEQAAATFGLYGPREVAPTVVHHPPGVPCPAIHKRPADLPPIFLRNGAPVAVGEFTDRIAESVDAVQHIRTRGL